MNTTLNEDGQNRLVEARNSYTGSRLTDSQFEEAWNIAGILNREIRKSGGFIEKLADYAHAFSRTERFDTARGETILRDLFTARYGLSMNKTREALMEREAVVRSSAQDQALHHARQVGRMIQEGPTMPFYQAYDRAAVAMAQKHGVTETGAKSMMKEAFEAAENTSLYETGKALEERYHRPVREAQRTTRRSERRQQHRSGPTM